MRSRWPLVPLGLSAMALLAACSSAPPSSAAGGSGGAIGAGGGGASVTADAGGAVDAGDAGGGSAPDASGGSGGAGGSAPDAGQPPVDALADNRERLLASYLDYLVQHATEPQTNGISGADVADVCDLWEKLPPSARAVFLTLTARMQASTLGADGSSMLLHVTRVYRVAGGQGATATDPGSCGGGEHNRMIMSMDEALHAALLAANVHKGATQANGSFDLADARPGGFWRDSHDLAGPHAPFDRSDETEDGAPRGQAQFFGDPSSPPATAPLGRVDLTSLVDPLALELDHDYDCIHASNPLCSYIAYGPFCLPMTSVTGVEMYESSYGGLDGDWHPAACGP
jgi:hypothetical protein